MIAGTRADNLRKLVLHLREDHLFDRKMAFGCLQAANARFDVPHVHRVIVALMDEAYGPAGDIGNRFDTLATLATHLWGTDLFSCDSVVEALLVTNKRFNEPLPTSDVYNISKETCK